MVELIFNSFRLFLSTIGLGVEVINISLIVRLINIYWKTYKSTKSPFTIGLLYFTTFLFLQNIVATIFLILSLFISGKSFYFEFYGPVLPLFLIAVVQLGTLIILFKITKK